MEFFFQPADQISQTLNFGIPAPIDVQFIGGKPNEILPIAAAFNNELRKIPGIVDAHVYQRWSKPTLSLEMNRTQLQQLGLSARNVAENMMISLSGSMQTTPTYWLNEANGNTYNIGAKTIEIEMDSIDELMGIPIGKGSDGKQQLLGNVVTIIAQAVINTGRKRVVAASNAAATGDMPCCKQVRANETSKILFAVATPMVMMVPVSAGTLRVVPVINNIHAIPASAAGKALIIIKGSSQLWKFTTTRK